MHNKVFGKILVVVLSVMFITPLFISCVHADISTADYEITYLYEYNSDNTISVININVNYKYPVSGSGYIRLVAGTNNTSLISANLLSDTFHSVITTQSGYTVLFFSVYDKDSVSFSITPNISLQNPNLPSLTKQTAFSSNSFVLVDHSSLDYNARLSEIINQLGYIINDPNNDYDLVGIYNQLAIIASNTNTDYSTVLTNLYNTLSGLYSSVGGLAGGNNTSIQNKIYQITVTLASLNGNVSTLVTTLQNIYSSIGSLQGGGGTSIQKKIADLLAVISGNSASETATNNNDASNNSASETINQYNDLESNFVADFNNSMGLIDTSEAMDSFASFAIATKWFTDQLFELYNAHGRMKILFTLPLLMGIALFFIGRGNVVFRSGAISSHFTADTNRSGKPNYEIKETPSLSENDYENIRKQIFRS